MNVNFFLNTIEMNFDVRRLIVNILLHQVVEYQTNALSIVTTVHPREHAIFKI